MFTFIEVLHDFRLPFCIFDFESWDTIVDTDVVSMAFWSEQQGARRGTLLLFCLEIARWELVHLHWENCVEKEQFEAQ